MVFGDRHKKGFLKKNNFLTLNVFSGQTMYYIRNTRFLPTAGFIHRTSENHIGVGL